MEFRFCLILQRQYCLPHTPGTSLNQKALGWITAHNRLSISAEILVVVHKEVQELVFALQCDSSGVKERRFTLSDCRNCSDLMKPHAPRRLAPLVTIS